MGKYNEDVTTAWFVTIMMMLKREVPKRTRDTGREGIKGEIKTGSVHCRKRKK